MRRIRGLASLAPCGLVLGLAQLLFGQTQSYKVTAIPPPAEGWAYYSGFSIPILINNLGQIVSQVIDPVSRSFVPFMATSTGVTFVPLPSNWSDVSVFGFNDLGQVDGQALGPPQDIFAGTVAGLVPIAGLTDSPFTSAGWSGDFFINGMNNAGQFVGSGCNIMFPFPGDSCPNVFFVGTASGLSAFPDPQVGVCGVISALTAINDSGQVVGLGCSGGTAIPIIGTPSSISVIPLPYGTSVTSVDGTSTVYGPFLNNAGQVLANLYTNGVFSPFVGSATGLAPLPLPPGFAPGGFATGFNDSGQAVGYVDIPSFPFGKFYVGSSSGTYDLAQWVPPGWVLAGLGGINNKGQIAAIAYDPGGNLTLIRLDPNTVTHGVDVSSVPSQRDWSTVVANVNPSVVVAGAFGGVSVQPAAGIFLSAIGAGITQQAAYFELCFPTQTPSSCLTPGQQFSMAIQQFGEGVSGLNFMGIAIEEGNYDTDPTDVLFRNKWIEQAVSAVAVAGLQPVIYTRRDYWANVTAGLNIPNQPTATGGIPNFGCLPLWDSWADGLDDLLNDGPLVGAGPIDPWTPYGGWQPPRAGKQYATDVIQFGSATVGTPFDLDVFSPTLFSRGSPSIALDESSATNVTVSTTGLRPNHATGQFVQTVTITNTSPSNSNIPGPLSLALDSLGANATLVGAAGATSCTFPGGSPFVNIPLGASGTLAPGESVSATLAFTNSTNAAFSYMPRVLAGSGTR